MPYSFKSEYRGISLVRDVFIETGTMTGGSLRDASKMDFKDLYSMDIVAKYVEPVIAEFRDDPRIHVCVGTSQSILPKVIDRKRATTFWMDAHFRGHIKEECDESTGQCPLLAELAVIFAEPWEIDPFVVIDDANLFAEDHHRTCAGLGLDMNQWPKMSQILASFPVNYSHRVFDEAIYFMPSNVLEGVK